MWSDATASDDPLGRAMLDYQRGECGRLRYRDGGATRDGRVREHYFRPYDEWSDEGLAFLERLADRGGPILDVGCGAGQHALWWQERGIDVVGVDVSPHAVAAARERGLEDALEDDMFDLSVPRDRFRTVHAVGTQLGLAGSLSGIAELLGEFARVATDDGIAVVDNYDPRRLDGDRLGYRPDPRTGIAHRCFHFEYVPADGDDREEADIPDEGADGGGSARRVGPTLHFLLCSPDRLRDATAGTPWAVTDVVPKDADAAHYKAVLERGD